MIPYANFLYFGLLLLYVFVPTLLLRLSGRDFRRPWIVLATALMLPIHFGDEFWIIAVYALMQWVLSVLFLRRRLRGKDRRSFYLAVALALLPLLVAKFLPYFAPKTAFGFLGISYLTFRSLDVIFNIEDGAIKELKPTQYFAYLLFFPTISSGPIDRYRRFGEDWRQAESRQLFLSQLDAAVHRLFEGFLYKFVLAWVIKEYWLDPWADDEGFIATTSSMYAYSLYLFFDFAGYSSFAIAVSYLVGINTPENFRYPFLAPNIREFWNRWHISLSTWFRDHVYMRFVFAATKGHWFKGKYTASHLGFLLTFTLMGLWHGTQPHYLVYGLYQAALLIGYDVFARWNKHHQILGRGRFAHIAAVIITFHFVCFGLLLFSGRLFR